MSDNGNDLSDRLKALERAGWHLVGERPPRNQPRSDLGENVFEQVGGRYTFERKRPFRGSRISETRETLEAAIEAAEWQAARLAGLEDQPREVDSGLGSG